MGTSERRQREIEERRRLIIDKSRELFFQKGYEHVSVGDICKAVEYGRSALYALFNSKEAIYANICVESLQLFAEMMSRLNPDEESLDEGFIHAVRIFFEFFQHHRPQYKALFYFSTDTYDRKKIDPELRATMNREEQNALSPLKQLLEKGIRTGEIRTMDVDVLVQLFWSSLMGIISSFLCKGMADQEALMQEYCLAHAGIYLHGLKTNLQISR